MRDLFDDGILVPMAAVVIVFLIIMVGGVSVQKDNLKAANAALAIQIESLKDANTAIRAELDSTQDQIKEYTAVASWYGPGFHGRRAADGSIYDQMAYTIAHKTLPFGTMVVLEYHGKRVPAMVTDRGPYIEGRDFDLSLGLAKRLGLVTKGVDEIKVYEIGRLK